MHQECLEAVNKNINKVNHTSELRVKKTVGKRRGTNQ